MAEAKRQWTAGLVQNGMTDIDAIKGGLRVARRSESPFLPSVGQFVAWCKRAKTEALQIPSRVEVESQILAYSSGAKGADQIHPLTYWVRQNMDYYRWRRGPSEKTDRLLDDAYSRALQLAIAGFEFPSAPVLIAEQAGPAKQPTQEMRQQAEQARAAALALFRISPEESAQ